PRGRGDGRGVGRGDRGRNRRDEGATPQARAGRGAEETQKEAPRRVRTVDRRVKGEGSMTPRAIRSVLGLLAAAACLPPRHAADAKKPEAQTVELTGKVVPLADLVAKGGSKLDADADPVSLVLVADDGKVYTLVKDGGARLFFKDKALLNRPMKLTGRLLP